MIRHSQYQKGAALIMVLWVALFLSLLLATALAVTRFETRIATADFERLKAMQAAKGGLTLAMHRLATEGRSANADILPLTAFIGEHEVTIDYAPEMNKLDINLASEDQLAAYLARFVDEQDQAVILAAQIMDWRDADDLVRINGAERRDYAGDARNTIANRPFISVGELNKVLGMTKEILECASGGLTVFGGKSYAGDSTSRQPPPRPAVNAGGRITLQATVIRVNGNSAPYALTGTYLFTGNRQRPFEKVIVRSTSPSINSANCQLSTNELE